MIGDQKYKNARNKNMYVNRNFKSMGYEFALPTKLTDILILNDVSIINWIDSKLDFKSQL